MIFNSVRSFVESVGRTRVSTRGQLDQLLVKSTGPTNLVDRIAPGSNAVHPLYPGMQVQTVRKIGEVAGVTTLEADYRGRFDGNKNPSFGDVLIEVSSNEGEIEFQQSFFTIGTAVTIRSFVRRFVGVSTTYRYVLNPKPAIKPGGPLFQSGLGPEFYSHVDRLTGQSQSSGSLVNTSLLADLYLSSYQASPVSQDWYQVTETWSSRYISVFQPS